MGLFHSQKLCCLVILLILKELIDYLNICIEW